MSYNRPTRSQNLKIHSPIYVRPPAILYCPPYIIFRILRPLYGLPNSTTHWFQTYHDHHREELSMVAASHDSCQQYTFRSFDLQHTHSDLKGITCLRTKDTFNLRNNTFLGKEETCSKSFEGKPSKSLVDGNSFIFNGITISIHKKHVTLSQP